jgi:hypothetical protein
MTPILNPKTLTYDAPTQNEDGTPLALADIEKFQLGAGPTSGNYTVIVDDTTLEATGRQISAFSLFAGKGLKGINYGSVRTVGKNGQVSAWAAGEFQFDLEAIPKAPSGFSLA